MTGKILYSEKYEYRHVVLPLEVSKMLPQNRLLKESGWRKIGGLAEPWLEALCSSSPGTTHIAFQEAFAAPAGKPGTAKHGFSS